MTDDRVFQSKIVHGHLGDDQARNHWSDVEEAKRWLEAYLRIRFDVEPTEWEEAEDRLGRWTMRVDDIDGRAVVMDHEVLDDATENIESLREIQQEMEAKA